MATANINDFITSIKKELARPSNFEVFIDDMPNSVFRCEAAELPSINFATVDQKTYGPIESFPVQHFYDKINLTFICSDDLIEKKYFDNWFERISAVNIAGAGARFDFEYKDNYQKQIQIKQYDITGKFSYGVKLINAYPLAINPLSLRWDATDSVHKLPITIAYRFYTPF